MIFEEIGPIVDDDFEIDLTGTVTFPNARCGDLMSISFDGDMCFANSDKNKTEYRYIPSFNTEENISLPGNSVENWGYVDFVCGQTRITRMSLFFFPRGFDTGEWFVSSIWDRGDIICLRSRDRKTKFPGEHNMITLQITWTGEVIVTLDRSEQIIRDLFKMIVCDCGIYRHDHISGEMTSLDTRVISDNAGEIVK
jgi:hypothetical protein